MATSSEQMNSAITALQGAADAYNGKNAEIDARLASLIGDVNTTMGRTIHIDGDDGDDLNSGSEASPLKTLQAAADLTVAGGAYEFILHSDVFVNNTRNVNFRGHSLAIRSSEVNTLRQISFSKDNVAITNQRPRVFCSNLLAVLRFADIRFRNFPANAGMTSTAMFEAVGALFVTALRCDFAPVSVADEVWLSSGQGGAVSFEIFSSTYGAGMDGLWVYGVAAGTNPDTLPWLLSASTLATL